MLLKRVKGLQEAGHEWHIYRDITVPITGQGDSGIVAWFLNVEICVGTLQVFDMVFQGLIAQQA